MENKVMTATDRGIKMVGTAGECQEGGRKGGGAMGRVCQGGNTPCKRKGDFSDGGSS